MKRSHRTRRSRRVPASHRLLFTVLDPAGQELLNETVTAVELSEHGARLRGYRTVPAEAQGSLTHPRSGRQSQIRVVWQRRAVEDPNFLDTGVEFVSGCDFLGMAFANASSEPAPQASRPPANAKPVAPKELLEQLRREMAAQNKPLESVLEPVWCGLIEQLERRRVLRRDELLEIIRSMAKSAATAPPKQSTK